MKIILAIILFTCATFFISANFRAKQQSPEQTTGYHYTLEQPDEIHILPETLIEVSGLTDLSSTEIACVQDEKGIIFTYNLTDKLISDEIIFAGDGDYEGVTRAKGILFSLTSEGTLYEIRPGDGQAETKMYDLELTAPDNEGLCYDEKENRLLIAPKSKLGKGTEYKDQRAVFVFDLKKRKMEKEPLFKYNVSDIYSYASEHKLAVHPRYNKNGTDSKDPKFRPSTLAVHPVTDEIYMISAEDFCLVIFDKTGNIKGFTSLNTEIFSKPEGLTFFPDGTMIITNEGVNTQPTLVVFKPKKQ